jgi:undecaprenyl-diphosphatase
MSEFFGGIENTIFTAIHSFAEASVFFDFIFIFCARFLVLIATIIFLGVLLIHREPYERLYKILYSSLALVISAGILQGVLNYFIYRPAPSIAFGFEPLIAGSGSLPAFATTWAVTIAFIAFYTLSKRLGGWLFAMALLIGFSQMYVGLHWPYDIAASVLVGILGPILASRILRQTKVG